MTHEDNDGGNENEERQANNDRVGRIHKVERKDDVERNVGSPTLILTPNLADADDFYDELLRAHEGLSDEQSEAFNARLILVLCNHIGDRQVITQALAAAQVEP